MLNQQVKKRGLSMGVQPLMLYSFLLVGLLALVQAIVVGGMAAWLFSSVIMAVCLVAYLTVSTVFDKSLTQILETLESWSTGSMGRRITGITDKNKIGRISWALNNVGDRVETLLREVQASIEGLNHGIMNRRIDSRGLYADMVRVAEVVNGSLDETAAFYEKALSDQKRIAEFEQSINTISTSLNDLSLQTDETSGVLAKMADSSASQAGNVASGAQHASDNVSAVAAATEQLSASIAEVTRQVIEAAGVTEEAVRQADRTTETVKRLGQEAEEIGSVVQVISDIAEQTNLLALNASIEAARAGEAGRGFAVVADEVKELASETAKATEQISKQIREIQTESSNVSKTIDEIGAIIRRMNEINAGISVSADEQSLATQEISSSIQHANQSVSEVNENIGEVARATEETGASARSLSGVSDQLKSVTGGLSTEVASFLRDLSAEAKSGAGKPLATAVKQ